MLFFFLVLFLPGQLGALPSPESYEGKIKSADRGFIDELLASDVLALDLSRKWPGGITILARHMASRGNADLALRLNYRAMAFEDTVYARVACLAILQAEPAKLDEEAIVRHLLRLRFGQNSRADDKPVALTEVLARLSGSGGILNDWKSSYGRTVLAALGHRWFQNGEFALVRGVKAVLDSWGAALGSLETLPLLEYAEPGDELRFLFDHELSLTGSGGSRNGFLLMFRREADARLTKVYDDLLSLRQFLADTRMAMIHTFGSSGTAWVDPLKSLPGSEDLEWLMHFKSRVFRKEYSTAWWLWNERWTASKGTLFSRWRSMAALGSDRDFGGLIKDVFNAGRLSGKVSATAAMLGEMAGDLKDQARVYALELSARLHKAAGDSKKAASVLEQALQEAEVLLAAGRFSLVDEQRILWYRLSLETESSTFVVKNLAPWIVKIKDKAFFADVFESIFLTQAARKAWESLYSVWLEFRPWMTEDSAAKYTASLGRYYQLENRRKANKKWAGRAKELLAAAYEQHDSLYYHAMASWFLGLETDVEGVLERQSRGDDVLSGSLSPAEEDELAVLFAMVRFGFLEGVQEKMVLLRRKLPPAGLMEIAALFSEAGRVPWSVKFADYRRAYFDHPRDRGELMLMYPRPFVDSVLGESEKRKVPWYVLYSLLRTESFFDAAAKSHVGAQGISQFMPATARATAEAMGLENYDIFDAETGIAFSAFHLRDLIRRQKNWSRVLGAYNAGPGRMQREYARLPTDQFLSNEALAIEETRNYIRRIIESSLVYEYLYHEKPDYEAIMDKFLVGEE